MRRELVVVLAGLVLLSGAQAAPPRDTAQLQTREPVLLPAGAHLDASWEALYCGRLAEGDVLRLQAPHVRVERHERTRVEAGPARPYVGHQVSMYDLTSVEITMTAAAGWIGAAATRSPGSFASIRFEEPVTVVPLAQSHVGNWLGTGEDPDDLPAFGHTATGPHLGLHAPLTGALGGALVLKVHGPTLRLAAAENQTTIATGPRSAVGGLDAVAEDVWLVLRFDAARVETALREECAFALDAAQVAGDGRWVVPAARGQVALAGTPHFLEGGPLAFDGALRASLLPVLDDESPVLRLEMHGQIDRSGLSGMVLPQPPLRVSLAQWLLLGPVLVGAGVAVGATVATRRRQPPMTIEQCVRMADAAAETGSHDEALEWTRRAQRLAPGSTRLRMDEAWFLLELGRVSEAVAACERAAEHASDGHELFSAALLLTKAQEPERAKRKLILALKREPCLAFEAMGDEAFATFRRDAEIDAAVRAALRQCR